jgi:hypothetical protein
MASISQCDQCRKSIPIPGQHKPGWIHALWHGQHPGERAPFGVMCAGEDECPELDFCSWRCAAEYATARDLIESPPQLPGTGGQ